jgi:hypothetical protein
MKVRILLIFIKSREMGIGRGNVVGCSSGSPLLTEVQALHPQQPLRGVIHDARCVWVDDAMTLLFILCRGV